MHGAGKWVSPAAAAGFTRCNKGTAAEHHRLHAVLQGGEGSALEEDDDGSEGAENNDDM